MRVGRGHARIWALLASCAAPAAGQVELRGVAEPVAGVVTSVGPEGVTLAAAAQTPLGSGVLIGWDVVRAVEGPEGGGEQWETVGTEVWRARARLERGDWAAAEPLLERLSKAYRGTAGPTAAVVHEGLLRCRLRRGAQGAAVWAWLDWTWAVDRSPVPASEWIGGKTSLPPVLDGATGLVPGLPPIWVGGASMSAVASSEEWTRLIEGARRAGGSDVVADLAALYRHAAAFEAGQSGPVPAVRAGHDGVALVAQIVTARTGDAAARAEARALLSRRIVGAAGSPGRSGAQAPATEPWIEAWCRAGLGRSLVLEQDVALRRKGVRELLHVPARFADEHPYLAGVCLAEAAVAMSEMGETDAAAALAGELRRRFAAHPALGWEKLDGLVRSGAGGGWGRGHVRRTDGPAPERSGDA